MENQGQNQKRFHVLRRKRSETALFFTFNTFQRDEWFWKTVSCTYGSCDSFIKSNYWVKLSNFNNNLHFNAQ